MRKTHIGVSSINFVIGYISLIWFGVLLMFATNTSKPNNPDGEIGVVFGILLIALSLLVGFAFEMLLYEKAKMHLKQFLLSQSACFLLGLFTNYFIITVIKGERLW